MAAQFLRSSTIFEVLSMWKCKKLGVLGGGLRIFPIYPSISQLFSWPYLFPAFISLSLPCPLQQKLFITFKLTFLVLTATDISHSKHDKIIYSQYSGLWNVQLFFYLYIFLEPQKGQEMCWTVQWGWFGGKNGEPKHYVVS